LSIAIAVTMLAIVLTTTSADADTIELHHQVDQAIDAVHVGPKAAIADDAQFVRRIYLDLVGRIPSIEEAQRFIDDSSEAKRAVLIDNLLASDECNQHLAAAFDIMWMERRKDQHVPTEQWRSYLTASFAANKPYNKLVAEILAADGKTSNHQQRAPAKFFLDRDVESHALTRDVSRMFLGRDIQCAQCHDHPLVSDYTQAEYYGLFAFLSRSYRAERDEPVEGQPTSTQKVSYVAEKAEGEAEYASVFEPGSEKQTALPGFVSGIALEIEPIFSAQHAYQERTDQADDKLPRTPRFSRRAHMASIATSPEAELFQRNIANRLWRLMFKRGLVEPPDLIHSKNRAVYPVLLDTLADEFVRMDYDIKLFLKQMALSDAYQRSFEFPAAMDVSAVSVANNLQAQEPALAESQDLDPQLAWQEDLVTRLHAEVSALEDRLNARRRELIETRLQLQQSLAAETKWTEQLEASKAKVAELTARDSVLQTKNDVLTEASRATEKALESSADDAELAAAAALLSARADTATKERDAHRVAVEQEQAAHDTAAQSLLAAQQQSQTLRQQVEQRIPQTLEASGAFRAIRLRFLAESSRLLQMEHRKSLAGQLREYQQAAAKRSECLQQGDALSQQADTEYEHAERRLREQLVERFVVADIKALGPEELAASVVEALGLTARFRDEAEQEWEQQQKKAAEAQAQDPATNPGESGSSEQSTAVAVDPDTRVREVNALYAKRVQQVREAFVALFSSSPGSPQDTFSATVDQALFLSNDGRIQAWIGPSQGNLADRLIKLQDDRALANELYLSAFTRLPTAEETQTVIQYVATEPDRRVAAIQELIWGMLTSVEFRFHH
jgi:hypothetical protein